MEKHAAYTGTRNLYDSMETAAKSLIANSSVDTVHFFIEDDNFPHELPDIIQCHNVSGQKFFPKNGPNMKTQFTYMAMIRVCYTQLLPEVSRILQLDVDTICVRDIDPIWDFLKKDDWVAMVEETLSTYKPYGPLYYNAGVALFDLDRMRKFKKDEKLIHFLNTKKVPYVDQDAVNYLASHVSRIPVCYNETKVTGYTDSPAIVHFAGYKDWQNSIRVPRREYIKKYKEMDWETALEEHSKRVQ